MRKIRKVYQEKSFHFHHVMEKTHHGNGNVFGAWDDVLSSVDTTEFLDAIQTGKVTNETIIRSWVKNQDLYR